MNFQFQNFQIFKKIILVLFISIAIFILASFQSSAQKSEICQTREECEKLLEKYELELAELDKEISKTGREKRTLENQRALLRRKIKKVELEIRQSNAIIKNLKLEISDTEASIKETASEVENSKENLAIILRTIYKKDQMSDLEILLSGEKISDYFNHLTNLKLLNLRNKEILGNIETAKALLENQKNILEEDKNDLHQVLKIQMLQKREDEEKKRENVELLRMTSAQHQRLQREKKEAEGRAAEIRARLLRLVGVREAPTYAEAIEVVKQVSKITDIRPAFLLGILTQESRIGRNVGQCYLQNFDTGMGVKFETNQKWPRVMRPTWIPKFLEITEELKLDPMTTPISCWIPACANQNDVFQGHRYVTVDAKGNIICHCPNCQPFGWGGAMGPAQFIPPTWNLYKDKIASRTGKVANPWDFQDATLAAALLLGDCRADLSERKAAACYFGGWGNRNRSYHLRVYADPVLSISKCHQDFIDTDSMSAWCERIIF